MSSKNISYNAIDASRFDEENTLLGKKVEDKEESLWLSASNRSWVGKNRKSLAIVASFLVVAFDVSPVGLNVLGNLLGANNSEIKVCVMQRQLIGTVTATYARVDCWDIDDSSNWDYMGAAYTGSNGCASIKYDGRAWWDYGTNWAPDVQCKVSKDNWVSQQTELANNIDTSKTKTFHVILTRDRVALKDSGQVNGCGPESTSGAANGIAAWILGFKSSCNNHDKCYFDCQIYDAFGKNKANAKMFCDDEMYQNMVSSCYTESTYFFDSHCEANALITKALFLEVGAELIQAYDPQCEVGMEKWWKYKGSYDNNY